MFQSILTFWFEECEPSLWWAKDDAFDQLIIERFSEVHAEARNFELFEWRASSQGRLAEIIVLDQFSRNMYRGQPAAFAQDALALSLAKAAVSIGADNDLTPEQRTFLYMPFMHSESLKVHEVGLALFEKNGIQSNVDFEIKHKNIIERFGRYPHRNQILGRESTPEEIAFLKQVDSSF